MAEYQKNAEKVEADKIEAARMAFKKCEDADVELRKATAKVQREAKAKVRKEAAAAGHSLRSTGSSGWSRKGWCVSRVKRRRRNVFGGWRPGGARLALPATT